MTVKRLSTVLIERTNGSTIVTFTINAIDKGNFATVADELEEIIRSPKPQSVVIDLTGVLRVDEIGLTVLQSLQESVKDVGGTATLRGPTGQLERAANETRLARDIDDPHSFHRPTQWTRW